jgi:hypothetical protein
VATLFVLFAEDVRVFRFDARVDGGFQAAALACFLLFIVDVLGRCLVDSAIYLAPGAPTLGPLTALSTPAAPAASAAPAAPAGLSLGSASESTATTPSPMGARQSAIVSGSPSFELSAFPAGALCGPSSVSSDSGSPVHRPGPGLEEVDGVAKRDALAALPSESVPTEGPSLSFSLRRRLLHWLRLIPYIRVSGYAASFLFWLDVLALLSLLPELPFMQDGSGSAGGGWRGVPPAAPAERLVSVLYLDPATGACALADPAFDVAAHGADLALSLHDIALGAASAGVPGGSDSGSMPAQSGATSNLSTARASRVSRIGARLGRILRTVRIVRLFKLYSIYRRNQEMQAARDPNGPRLLSHANSLAYESSLAAGIPAGAAAITNAKAVSSTDQGSAPAAKPSDGAASYPASFGTAGALSGTVRESQIGHRLGTATARTAIIVVLAMVIAIPVFTTTPLSTGHLVASLLLHRFNVQRGSHWQRALNQAVDPYLVYSDVSDTLSSDRGKRELLYLNVRALPIWIDVGGRAFFEVANNASEQAQYTWTPADVRADFQYLREYSIEAEIEKITLLSIVSASANFSSVRTPWSPGLSDGSPLVAWNPQRSASVPTVSDELLGEGIPLNGSQWMGLRIAVPGVARASNSSSSSKIATATAYATTAWFNIRPYHRMSSILSIGLTLFIIAHLLLIALLFSMDAQRLVLRPIENMIAFAERMAYDPVGVSTHLSSKDNSGAYEARLLQNTVKKIMNALTVSFGPHGILVLARHLQSHGLQFFA